MAGFEAGMIYVVKVGIGQLYEWEPDADVFLPFSLQLRKGTLHL
jgi:hypothetical protein